jgi:L-alanine-DL-glutamate epimerase-like enolase superfamily enzyme
VEQALLSRNLQASAALAFALEGLEAQRSLKKVHPVRSNALLPWGEPAEVISRALSFREEGYSVIKLKVSAAETGALLEVLSALSRSGLSFRLDGNRALTESRALTLFRGLEQLTPGLVEYLEEPLSSWENPALACCPIPLAADESAADPREWERLLALEHGPAVFVLKPTVSGGLMSLAARAERLRDAGKKVVFTSAIEAEPGRRALLAFLASQELPICGLSTGFLFQENFLPDKPEHSTIPAPDAKELAWIDRLDWRPVP